MKQLIILFIVIHAVYTWNTCSDESFCDRIRNQGIVSSLSLDTSFLSYNNYDVQAVLYNSDADKSFTLSISATDAEIFRIRIDDPLNPRHSVPEALDGELELAALTITEEVDRLSLAVGESLAVVEFSPFKITVYKNNEIILIINDRNKLTINSEDDVAVALDFTFPGATTAYGIPEHAEGLSLQSTEPGGLDPYRMFNADYPAYAIGTQEALYGAVPVLYGHSTTRTAGVFWLNSAQTFVDVTKQADQVQSLFVSEGGVIDVFVLTGPTFESAAKQYISLTGPAPLPQYFALGHHQSRWSYLTQDEAEEVIREFDNHDFPLDVIWLDIDYTDAFKYFTWNYTAFPDPVGMQEYINSTGRKLVLIIDPHYKVEDGYTVYETLRDNNYFVKNPDGSDYQAECWPGLSSWIDYTNPEAAAYYSSLFGMDSFANVTDIVYIWNDMNEPAVFDVDEKTMPKDVLHYGNVPHRDVHNMYGFTQTMATYSGLLARYDNTKRPFILTRAHFAGTQRYSAVWTGDNYASWEHLRISFAICLTQAIAGISFCGADVGGFTGEVTDELFQRWYQAGAWLPFYRAHSEETTERREPYLYSEEMQTRFRNAIRQRYYHLPLWYTLFYEHERYGDPVIRPLSYVFPSDPNTLDIDNEWLIGNAVLVHPVAIEGASEVDIYFPGDSNELWYSIDNDERYTGNEYVTIPVTMDSVPVFYRGGSIIARKETHRSSSAYMRSDPYTIYVFVDATGEASGTLYIDDYESFEYRNNVYNYYGLKYADGALNISKLDVAADYSEGSFTIAEIVVYAQNEGVSRAVFDDSSIYPVSYSVSKTYLKVSDLNVAVRDLLDITFE
ncbi:Galactose mutarotase-like [Popillia japonica]|uniref:Glucosidase II subunit alpha n=2 Tax=Popillia japonica TaxID=7064 RepID=A0AAW1I738_POPJA